jgi:hypothetical protein
LDAVTSQLHLRKAAVDEHLGMIRIKRFAGGAGLAALGSATRRQAEN